MKLAPWNRSAWASKLATELERPNTLIDFGYIVIWLDHAGWYNHATSFKKSDSSQIRVAVSRFRQFKIEPDAYDLPGYPEKRRMNPLMEVWHPRCGHQAMDLTRWVVAWSRSNENGTEFPLEEFGLKSMTHPPKIIATHNCIVCGLRGGL